MPRSTGGIASDCEGEIHMLQYHRSLYILLHIDMIDRSMYILLHIDMIDRFAELMSYESSRGSPSSQQRIGGTISICRNAASCRGHNSQKKN